MTIDPSSISRLADLLTSQQSAMLTPEDASILAAALIELGAAQTIIARQTQLLASYDHDVAAIDASVRRVLALTSDALGAGSVAQGYDFAAASTTRAELVRTIESAETGKAIISAVLGFVMKLVVPN